MSPTEILTTDNDNAVTLASTAHRFLYVPDAGPESVSAILRAIVVNARRNPYGATMLLARRLAEAQRLLAQVGQIAESASLGFIERHRQSLKLGNHHLFIARVVSGYAGCGLSLSMVYYHGAETMDARPLKESVLATSPCLQLGGSCVVSTARDELPPVFPPIFAIHRTKLR